jgi:transcription antitermination factor NusA-like protein
VIVISGKKKDVEQAKQKVLAFQNELTNAVQVDLIIPSKFHNSIIGAKGRLIRSIMEENGGVLIKFPAEGSGSDKVSIRGPKDCVAKAKAALVELSNDKQENGHTVEVKAKPEHHKFLIGKNGANIKKVRDTTGARIIFPTDKDDDRDTIIVIGKKDGVLKAKTELEAMIKDLDKIVEDSVEVPNKHHAHFVTRRGAVLKQIQDEFGGVNISFPGRDTQNNKVVIKGAKECVAGAKAKIQEEVKRLESLVTVEVEIDSRHHRSIMGAKGNNVKKIQSEHDIQIKFPERRTNGNVNGKGGDSTPVNGSNGDDNESVSSGASGRRDIIVLVGPKQECESAKQALLALIPVEESVEVPFDYHRFIIGQKGKDVRELMDKFDVNISIPPSQDQEDTIKIYGSKDNVSACKQALLDKVTQLNEEKKERQLKSFREEIHINPEIHPKIIGKKGFVINKIREKFGVVIQFPDRVSKQNADPSLITITGYEDKVIAARDHILSFAKEYESQVSKEVRVDSRVHSRLIGQRGKNIKSIMNKFGVDVKFPREGDNDPNIITISGQEEDVDAAKDHILNLEEEYVSLFIQFMHSPDNDNNS